MIGDTSRRASRLLLLTAAVVLCAFGGAALAQGNSISITPPTNAKVGKSYSLTVSGYAAQTERLYLFDDIVKCGPNPHVEHAAPPAGHSANGADYVVSGAFSKTSRGWRSPRATTYHVCAYLAGSSEPLNSANGVLLRAGKKFNVSG